MVDATAPSSLARRIGTGTGIALAAVAVFLIWADAAARVVMAPEDMPIGVVTGLIGGVFFIWMMAQRR